MMRLAIPGSPRSKRLLAQQQQQQQQQLLQQQAAADTVPSTTTSGEGSTSHRSAGGGVVIIEEEEDDHHEEEEQEEQHGVPIVAVEQHSPPSATGEPPSPSSFPMPLLPFIQHGKSGDTGGGQPPPPPPPQTAEEEDHIPGPPPDHHVMNGGVTSTAPKDKSSTGTSTSSGKTMNKSIGNLISRVLNTSNSSSKLVQQQQQTIGQSNNSNSSHPHHARKYSRGSSSKLDELNISTTEHNWVGQGILASRADLNMAAENFAAGCTLLQAAALGSVEQMQIILATGKTTVDFRDYDRRTALHVAASEGHLRVCQYLIEDQHARINRSDRWGGSPLDDAHRHRHVKVIQYLRDHGASTGSGNRLTNLITAAAEGDVDEVRMLLLAIDAKDNQKNAKNKKHHRRLSNMKDNSNSNSNSNDQNRTKKGGGNNSNDAEAKAKVARTIDRGDYDHRTALHLAAGEGHADIVKLLLEMGADPNVEDRWHRRPLDDAMTGQHDSCITILKQYGATVGTNDSIRDSKRDQEQHDADALDKSIKRQDDNLKIDFAELEMIDRIGAGAFGEIYKCRWRGTLVAAKIIKTAKIRKDWATKKIMQEIRDGTRDVDDALREVDDVDDNNALTNDDEKSMAIADFRQEISVLKSLRHPYIVLLLAYSTTADHEVMISELMKCSLLDVFKSHIITNTRMPRRTQIAYAVQLAIGMNYLHTCRPPIIHRDLKPANLLVDHSGVLKISDFGLSKVRPDPTQKEQDEFVMTGETGSYRYMAPEVYRHEDYNETVDVYSYGMILFYLFVGRPPWPTLSGISAVKKAAEEGDRPNIPRDLDQRLQNLLKECWNENANARPGFSQIIKMLEKYSMSVFHVQDASQVATMKGGDDRCVGCAIL